MDAHRVPGVAGGDRARKRAGRLPCGVKLKTRAGFWVAVGTLRLDAERTTLVRKSLGLSVAAVARRDAEIALDALVRKISARALGHAGPGDSLAVAADGYLSRTRSRPLGASTVRIVKEVAATFTTRPLNSIAAHEWREFVDTRQRGNAAATRERFLNVVLAFLAYAKRQHALAEVPTFVRDQRARNPNRRARRRVAELRPDLVRALFDACHISIRAQLAVERATGARVSSILYGCRLCDLILAKGREQIIFHNTKNGDDVPAALDPTAVAVLRDYLKWRGKLHEREAPLFLTYRRRPYVDNGRDGGGQNKTGFMAAKRRACAAIVAKAEAEAARLDRAGKRAKAAEVRAAAAADADLLRKVTQHWFRHWLAQRLVPIDPRAAMAQGGWIDPRSVMGYTHDVEARRRRLVAELDDLAPAKRRDAK